MEIKTIGVIGAGQMGSGIAQVTAASGCSVVMNDIKDEFLERGFSAIEGSLARLVKKGALSEEDAKVAFETIAEGRDWLGAPIYRYARQLFG